MSLIYCANLFTSSLLTLNELSSNPNDSATSAKKFENHFFTDVFKFSSIDPGRVWKNEIIIMIMIIITITAITIRLHGTVAPINDISPPPPAPLTAAVLPALAPRSAPTLTPVSTPFFAVSCAAFFPVSCAAFFPVSCAAFFPVSFPASFPTSAPPFSAPPVGESPAPPLGPPPAGESPAPPFGESPAPVGESPGPFPCGPSLPNPPASASCSGFCAPVSEDVCPLDPSASFSFTSFNLFSVSFSSRFLSTLSRFS